MRPSTSRARSWAATPPGSTGFPGLPPRSPRPGLVHEIRTCDRAGGVGGGVRSPDPYLLRVVEAANLNLVAGQRALAECDSAWSEERAPPPTTGPARLALREPSGLVGECPPVSAVCPTASPPARGGVAASPGSGTRQSPRDRSWHDRGPGAFSACRPPCSARARSAPDRRARRPPGS